tara:strand:+ start:83 stop:475 length:393 start_codon:yes stop_codon:yes gene_type:complete
MSEKPQVRQNVPLLTVSDLQLSLKFYVDQLGFTLTRQADNQGQVFWCWLEKDQIAIMLQQADPSEDDISHAGQGVTLYWLCDDVDAVHAQLKANGMQMDDPTVAYYGMKQLYLKDPDGYDLCFECEMVPS